jgi:NAD(P)-dependent dehydrogenase (short-subunit alcohol dehydrogenase family)
MSAASYVAVFTPSSEWICETDETQAYQCDVSDQKAVQDLFQKIYHDVGPIGGVVCNAGTSRPPQDCSLLRTIVLLEQN